jgi:hypothetical protein
LLQWFESSQETMIDRAADVFIAGFGAVWLPPPGRADISDFSVGYDVYDRFDLGSPGRKTLYGTETGLKILADTLHRASVDVHIDAIINHNGFSDLGTPGFVEAGGYPGMAITLPYDIDGDFNSAFDWGDIRGRLAGLIDIDHAKNYSFIRSPVTPGDPNNIPLAGTTPDGAGRLANVPTPSNRRFYPDLDLPPIFVYDPMTGEGDIPIYPFNLADPTAGDATSENATGYLMRYLQWMVQTVGVDGFRVDAAKHIEGFTLDFFDRAVYRSNPRLNLDGSTKYVFSYQEVFDGDKNYLQTFIKKTIDPGQPGVVGANRDVLDFPLQFALRDNLSGNGFANDWHNIRNASMDFHDDGLHNGSQGVMFVQSHDEHAPELTNVAHAYVLMHPGNAVIYFNGKEFGDNRDFPKDGRGDAIGGAWGDYARRLVSVRNTHGRGDYIERWIEKEIFAFERAGSAIVLLSNRTDAGYDSRTIQTTFAPGTPLIELTGTASNGSVDPHNDISELIVVNGDGTANVRFLRNSSYDLDFNSFYHATGALIYGLSGPQAPAGIELSGVSSVLSGSSPDANGYSNGVTRLTDLHVVTGDTLGISVQTVEVNLLGFHRDVWADGDNILVKVDDGIDINGNGYVDFTTPGQVHYGFEQFTDKREPLIGPGGLGDPGWSGDGEFIQNIDTTGLTEGVHFIEARAFRHRTDGGPAIYSSFKKVIYVDRLAPVSAVEGFQPFDSSPSVTENQDLIVRSTDKTADQVHVFLDEPASTSDADLIQRAVGGEGSAGRIDQDLFAYGFFGLTRGNHAATVVTFEPTGTVNVQRFGGLFTETANGAGIGDVNFDSSLASDDIDGFGWGFEHILYAQNDVFNPAADVNGDARIDNRDLYALGGVLQAGGAPTAAMDAYAQVLDRRGDINQQFGSDQWDIDALYDKFGSTAWYDDLDSDGAPAGQGDVDQLVRVILATDYGDANLDGLIDIDDLQILGDNWHGAAGWASGDFTGDGLADLDDAGLMELNWTSAQEFGEAWHEVFPGDSDGDGDVDDDDYHDMIAQFGGTPGEDNADFNNDGRVDLRDFAIMREFFSQAAAAPGGDLEATATPEPTALVLLGAAIPWVLRRKRKP